MPSGDKTSQDVDEPTGSSVLVPSGSAVLPSTNFFAPLMTDDMPLLVINLIGPVDDDVVDSVTDGMFVATE